MPMPNPFPLNIPTKVNSPELLAYFAQFGEEGYLSAEEINKIDLALKFLYENNIAANQNNTWREVFLGFTNGTKVQTDALFEQELIVSATENVMLVYVDMSFPHSTHRYKFAKGKGPYNPIPMEIGVDILLESVTETFPSIPVIISGANTQTFNLGDIGETPLSEYVNNNGDYDMEDDSKTYLFLFERSEITYLYRFIGVPAIYGEGFLESSEEDFDFLTSSDVEVSPIDQDNVAKKVTYTFAELELDPQTATREEIIAAVKIAHSGNEVADNELRYIEVIEDEISYNFSVTNSWSDLEIIDEESFKTNFLDGFLSSYTISDFIIDGNKISCNLTDLVGFGFSTPGLLNPAIVHVLNLFDLTNQIFDSGAFTFENIQFNSPLNDLYIVGLTNDVFDYELPDTIRFITINDSNLKRFTSQLPSECTSVNFYMCKMTISDYELMEEWATNLPTFIDCQFDFSGNIDSITGSALESILISKNAEVVA